MAQLQITMPESLNDWIEAKVQTGRYVDVSDYLRDLVRRDQEANDDLLDALEEAAASGDSGRTLDDIWEAAKARAGNG